MKDRKLELVADFYEFTMANGYFEKGIYNQVSYFDLFFRRIPDGGGYVITSGLQQVIEYIQNLKFDEDEIEYLKALNIFSNNFLDYLKDFKFTGDLWAIPEGTIVYPNEPIITVKAPLIEAQLLETMLLLTINHQSLIATKTSRIVNQAKGRTVFEFGARRAHGVDASTYGARAAIIGGALGTSLTLSAQKFNIKPSGTMAHSWIQTFDTEYEAFKTYAEVYPDTCTLLVDTFNTIESGIPNAIKVFNEVLVPKGYRPNAIRLDSGDLAYLSKKARKMLDEAGFEDCKIVATNSLDEHLIKSLLEQGAKIDIFGVGENLITAKSEPVFGGVYKLAAIEKDGELIPKVKISENTIKVTNPSFKKIYRFYDNTTGNAIADVITLHDEIIPKDNYVIFDPENPWKKKNLTNYTVVELQQQIFKNGKLVYDIPNLNEIVTYSKNQLNTLWDEIKRIENPHKYTVDLSKELWQLKNTMLNNIYF